MSRKVDVYGSYTESCNPHVIFLQASSSLYMRCLWFFLVVFYLWNVLKLLQQNGNLSDVYELPTLLRPSLKNVHSCRELLAY